ncbi:hypothetical protein GBA52_011349, partial [Prunus armeniaca]
VHVGLSEEEKMKICCVLNYEKLSSETCIHLSQNKKFPSKAAVQALVSQQLKLKSLLHATNNSKSYADSPCSAGEIGNEGRKFDAIEKPVLYATKLDLLANNEKLRAHLQGMQCRVMELEKLRKKKQTQMAKFTKSRASSHSHTRFVPKLCS